MDIYAYFHFECLLMLIFGQIDSNMVNNMLFGQLCISYTWTVGEKNVMILKLVLFTNKSAFLFYIILMHLPRIFGLSTKNTFFVTSYNSKRKVI